MGMGKWSVKGRVRESERRLPGRPKQSIATAKPVHPVESRDKCLLCGFPVSFKFNIATKQWVACVPGTLMAHSQLCSPEELVMLDPEALEPVREQRRSPVAQPGERLPDIAGPTERRFGAVETYRRQQAEGFVRDISVDEVRKHILLKLEMAQNVVILPPTQFREMFAESECFMPGVED